MKKILLVSHQEAFLERNKSLLNRAGFAILTAGSVEEALQTHQQQPVDLIVSMLEMDDAGGDTLCAHIRNHGDVKLVPVILVCYDTDASLKRASESGANAFVTKPVHPERLLDKVARFLRIPIRRDYRAMFTAKVRGTQEAVTFSGMTHNISVSGIRCETATALNRDDLVSNLLMTVDAQEVVADGRVVRIEVRADGMFNYGIQFTNISAESVEAIERFVAKPGSGGAAQTWDAVPPAQAVAAL